MSETHAKSSPTVINGKFGSRLRSLAVGVALLAVPVLGALNVLTLTNQDAHSKGYDWVTAVLVSMASDAVVSKMLEKSPTKQKQVSIKSATKALAGERTALIAASKVLEVKHASLESAHKEVLAKHTALERVHNEVVAKHTELSKAHKALESTHGNLKAKQQRQANVARGFAANLARRTVAGAARNAGTVIPRSVPYAGAAVVVSIAGLDLYDACETMRQLDALNREFDSAETQQQKVCGLKIPGLN